MGEIEKGSTIRVLSECEDEANWIESNQRVGRRHSNKPVSDKNTQ